jgi:hypothetical protein
MNRSESGVDLLNAPDLSVPFKMSDFKVPGVGGGFIVVNHYGENVVSVARVDVGVIGEKWNNIDESLLYLHRIASFTSNKCTATDLKIGGAGILLYWLLTRETDTVFLSDPDPTTYDKPLIPPRAFTAWDKANKIEWQTGSGLVLAHYLGGFVASELT